MEPAKDPYKKWGIAFLIFLLILIPAEILLIYPQAFSNLKARLGQSKASSQSVKWETVNNISPTARALRILEINLSYDENKNPSLDIASIVVKKGSSPVHPPLENGYKLRTFDEKKNVIDTFEFEIPNTLGALPLLPGEDSTPQRSITLKKVNFTLTLKYSDRAKSLSLFDTKNNLIKELSLSNLKFLDNNLNYESTSEQSSLLKQLFPIAFAQTGRKLNITFIGDGYNDMNAFDRDADRLRTGLLQYEPFKTRASQISFNRVENKSSLGCNRSDQPGLERVISCDQSLVTQQINNSGAPYDVIVVVTNDQRYGGSAGAQIIATYNGQLSKDTFTHELGHALGLRDEYVARGDEEGEVTNRMMGNCYSGDPKNTSAFSDVAVILYKGCDYKNWYRTSQNSIMRSIDARYFNAASFKIINRRLDLYTSLTSQDTNPTPIPSVAPSQIAQAKPVTNSLSISGIDPDNLLVGDTLMIFGQGFGKETGSVELSSGGLSYVDSLGYVDWRDNLIKVQVIQARSLSKATIVDVTVMAKNGEKVVSPTKLTLMPRLLSPSPVAIASASPTLIFTPTPTPTPTSTPTPTPAISASPISSANIPCGNGGICRSGICLVGDTPDPNGVCPTPTSILTPTPTSASTPTPASSAQPIKKEITKIAVVSVDNGQVLQEIDPKVSSTLSFHLPVAGSNKVLIHIYYSDGSERQPPIPFTFTYTPAVAVTPTPSLSPDEAYCHQIGGRCESPCSEGFSQVGTATCASKNQLCCSKPVATPQANVSKCPGGTAVGPVSSGWGGPCTPGKDADRVLLTDSGTACTVASCYLDTEKDSSHNPINEYCWYNSGTPYNSYDGCYRNGQGVKITTPTPTSTPTPTPTPAASQSSVSGFSKTGACYQPNYNSDIVCHGNPFGAGGQCDSAGQQSNPLPCTITCPDGSTANGTSVSTCGTDGCYTNNCSCNANCISP